MALRKDYLLDQLRDFFAALNRIAARIQAGELERAEEEIDALTSLDAIGELMAAVEPVVDVAGEGVVEAVPDHIYAAWKFQVQLLLLKIRVIEARGMETAGARSEAAGARSEADEVRSEAAGLRARAVAALRKLIALKPDVYDIELAEQLRGLEGRH